MQGDVSTFFRYKGKLFYFARADAKVEHGTTTVEESLEELRAQMVLSMRYGSTFLVDLDKSTPDFKTKFTHKEIFDSDTILNFEEFRKRETYMKFVKKEEIFSPGGMNNVFYLNETFTFVFMTSLTQQEDIDKLL